MDDGKGNKWTDLLLISFLIFVRFVNGVAEFAILPFFTIHARDRDLTPVQVGLLLGCVSFIQFICLQVIGLFAHRLHLKLAILFGISMTAVRCLGMAFPFDGENEFFWSSLLFQALEGIGSALSSTGVRASLITRYPDRASQLQPLMEAIGTVGAITGPAIGGGLYIVLGYKGPFLAIGFTLLSLVVIGVFIIPQQKDTGVEKEDKKCGQELWSLLSRPKMWVVLLVMLWSTLNIGIVEASIAPFLAQLGTPASLIPGIFMVDPTVVIVSSIVMSRVAKGRESTIDIVIVFGFLFSASAFALNGPMFPLTDVIPSTVWLAVASQALLGLSLGIQETGGFIMGVTDLKSMGREGDSGFSTAFSALILSASACGMSLGPLVGGYAIQILSYSKASTLMFASQLMMMMVVAISAVVSRIGQKKSLDICPSSADHDSRAA